MLVSLPLLNTPVSVSETFVSVQGEGLLTGVPSAFIRLSGCNLRCAWCDTPYASWEPEGESRTIDDLVSFARSLPPGVRHVVLTGGEPMLFAPLVPLSARLRELGLHITIETAGTVIPPEPDGQPPLACDLMSISPKLASSTPRNDPRDPAGVWADRHERRRINLPVLRTLLDRFGPGQRQLKFVVTSASDVDEIRTLLAQLPGVGPGEVLLMPEGVTAPDKSRSDEVLRACLEHGFRYCRRLHIDLFGHTRGT